MKLKKVLVNKTTNMGKYIKSDDNNKYIDLLKIFFVLQPDNLIKTTIL